MQSLSVLIPVYNYNCLSLVEQLHRQLEQTAIPYEIIVGDDGSTDSTTIQANQPINELSHCHYIVRTENKGRAVIRNFLAQTAQYDFLLLIDSDMTVISETFIQNYLAADCQTVVDGGIIVCGDPDDLKGNLRYLYEKAEEPHHTVSERQRSPHQHIHTANLLIRRDLMLQYPLSGSVIMVMKMYYLAKRFTSIMFPFSISTTHWECAPSKPMLLSWRRPKKDCEHSIPSAKSYAAIRVCSPSSQASISLS